jgi:hypothetical protein
MMAVSASVCNLVIGPIRVRRRSVLRAYGIDYVHYVECGTSSDPHSLRAIDNQQYGDWLNKDVLLVGERPTNSAPPITLGTAWPVRV